MKYTLIKFTLVLFALFLMSCSDDKKATGENLPNGSDKNFFEYLSKIKLPDKLDFCGEVAPLGDSEVRERAEREFYVILQQPGQLILYLKRSGRYFELFERIIKENDMPDDIKYVAVAESALFMARSSKDAVGLWQFIPETARQCGLEVNDFVDERRSPEKSTVAAMKYLKEGYVLHKSWTMAAAGYNMGHKNLADNVEFQKTDNFYNLYLNEETSRYIFRILLIKEMMTRGAAYGLKIDREDYYKPENTKVIECSTEIEDLSEWAISHGTTYKDVKILNPWILKRKLPRPITGKVYEIQVPAK